MKTKAVSLILFSIVSFLNTYSYAQVNFDCGGVFLPSITAAASCVSGSSAWLNTYKKVSTYVP